MKQHKLLLLLLLMSIGCGERVDLLVHNAQVYTVNDNFDKVSAFAVKNGKFVAVGGGLRQVECFLPACSSVFEII